MLTVKLAFVKRAGTRDRGLSSSQAANRDCIPDEERATSELPMMLRSHQVTASVGIRLRTNPCTDKNYCACAGDVNRRMCRSRCRVGWWEISARLFSYRSVL